MSKLVYKEIEVTLRSGKEAITADEAKELLGWETEPDGKKKGWGSDYAFKDLTGKKVRLRNNPTNRPFRRTLAQRYANEMLRKKWQLNGEAIIVDRLAHIQSGQHRLVAVVFAEQTRLKAVEKWREDYGWRGPVSVDMLIVNGISEKPETVDTLDIGQKRSLGDVIFRNDDFGKQTDRDAKRLSNMLAGATRLAWLRSGGRSVSDAPHFPHSEALDFIEEHPRLRDAVEFIFNEDGGKEKLISGHISLAYAAGLMYLMSTAATDPEAYQTKGFEELDFTLQDKAEQFWVEFAQGVGTKADDSPLFHLRNRLGRIDASGAMGRDEVIGSVIKAFNLWVDGKPAKSSRDVTVAKSKNEEGKMVLAEEPRLGGLDVEVEVVEEEPEEEAPVEETKEEKPKTTGKKTGSKGKKQEEKKADVPDFDPGTKVKVSDEEGDWTGVTGDSSDYGNGRKVVIVVSDEDGAEYEVDRVNVKAA